jgi:hypothetical protein
MLEPMGCARACGLGNGSEATCPAPFFYAWPSVRTMTQGLSSCQFLAQNTHSDTPLEKGRKALLERLRQGM